MDARGSFPNGRNTKLRQDDIFNENDRISRLPASIKCRILSNLPTKYAFRTSVLSTQWKYLWTSVTNLIFERSAKYRPSKNQRLKFTTFVDRMLLLHESQVLNKFTLHCNDTYDANRVKTWITCVLRLKKPQIVDIMYDDKSFIFPFGLFDRYCGSLIVLKLNMPCLLKVPNDVCFSSLKKLELHRMVIAGFASISFSFPEMEDLVFADCVWCDVKVVNIVAPLLKSVYIGNSTRKWVLDYSKVRNSTYEWVLDMPNEFLINIHGENLTKFELKSDFREDITLHKASSVVDASVDANSNFYCFPLNQWPMLGLGPFKLLKQLTSVKYLTLSNIIIEALALSDSFLSNMPIFEKLTHLKVSRLSSLKTLMCLLQTFPILESLTFSVGLVNGEEEPSFKGSLPSCIVSHVKFITVQEFVESEKEFRLVKFLMRSAEVLEEFAIHFPSYLAVGKSDMKKQLLSFPRVSPAAKVVIIGG